MRKKQKNFFDESLQLNNATYIQYYNRLTELAISVFEWKNLPPSIDPRFLEMVLYSDGMCVFFYDDVLEYLALQTMIGGNLNVYRIPIDRVAYATNGYKRNLSDKDSVIIYNNYLHTNSMLAVEMYSRRLTNIERAIDVNVNSQKTPTLIQCEESQKLTMLNLYKEYDGNSPVIFGNKSLDTNGIKVLKTDAPYVSDRLFNLKTQTWNEALTYLGISNVNIMKKERLVSDEVTRNQGGVIASRFGRLASRQEACTKINEMFGLDIWVEYRDDFREIVKEESDGDTIE